TLIGILAGAFSGAALGRRLTEIFGKYGVPPTVAEPLGYGLVIAVITYLSVVIGELVPKNLALRNSERLACLVAPLMSLVSRVGAPVVWV
ncbi:CNNM domain-containing protein, partial [Enterobacter cloacae]|uniref:CNNM domain-containing protein n=1 Tax=Enterobacter cloacae TaxID=550 RepID=UPI0013D29CE0